MLIIIILVTVAGLVRFLHQYYKGKTLPPYSPKGFLPIIGHAIFICTAKNYYNLITSSLKHALDQKMELLTVRFGFWNVYAVLNPDDGYLVANTFLKKDILYDYFKPFFGDGLITADVPTWKVHRKFLNPTFNQQVLDGYLSEINKQSRQLLDALAVKAGKGAFNQHIYSCETFLRTVYATSMGTAIDKEDEQTRQLFIDILNSFLICMVERIAKFWLHNNLLFKLSGRKQRQDLLAVKLNLISQAILNKKKTEFQLSKQQTSYVIQENRFKSFMELLLELSENGELTDKEITDEINTFIAAGSDTMAAAFSIVLTCVGTYGTVQDRIFAELHEVFEGSDRDVDKEDLPKLKYLEAVIRETMRLYPVVLIIGRKLDKELQIRDCTLPADSMCYIAIYAILRHWSWGADADTFRPERWLDGSVPANLRRFAAFGLGKRSCIGANFALMCIKTILASFLRRYSIKGDVTKMVQEFLISSKPISGHEIFIEERQ